MLLSTVALHSHEHILFYLTRPGSTTLLLLRGIISRLLHGEAYGPQKKYTTGNIYKLNVV